MQLPLAGITVLEFSQYLSGPVAGLRLADLGAEVIKIERPEKGEAGRALAIKNLWVDDDSLLFHTINRNKGSLAVDLKQEEDVALVKKLIEKADVITHNFRPGIMEKIGLDYPAVKKINPRLIYAEISGYGKEGPWKNKPGQDLLVQSISGLTYSTGDDHHNPVPFGLSIADGLTGNQAVQGILAALIRRQKTGSGALLQLSLLESLIDFQFEFFTTYFQSSRQHRRSAINNGHSLLGAPYGIYATADGWLAVAMTPLARLNAAIACEALAHFSDGETFSKRDEIKAVLARHFRSGTTAGWLEKMRAHDLWVMPVLNWGQLRQSPAYQSLQMEQALEVNGKKILTTRCPIRINGERMVSAKGAPAVGQDNPRFESWKTK
jgi:CoA:oxalate CoA-transferase